MFNKKITFCAIRKEMLEVWPHPKPASRFIPEEYKKLERFENSNKDSRSHLEVVAHFSKSRIFFTWDIV